MKNKRALLVLALLITSITIYVTNSLPSQSTNIKLLAVSEMNNHSFTGETADLYFTLKDGNGGVFLDTFPLTKIDTQISTRYAKEIACREAKVDCSKYNFFYTIRASSPIIGGPSASGAIATVTLAKLKGFKIKKNVAMTGTINSGGLIGPVGGVKEKIKAAARAGIQEVLIPKIELYTYNNQTNETEFNNSLIKLGEDLGVKVIPIDNVYEAVYYFTGKNITPKSKEINNPNYDKIMKNISIELCGEAEKLRANINLNKTLIVLEKEETNKTLANSTKNVVLSLYNQSTKLINLSKEAFNKRRYYAAASYCFGADTKLKTIQILGSENLSKYILQANETLTKLKDDKRTSFKTITELQTYLIIEDRVKEAENSLNSALKSNTSLDKASNLAYVIEREKTINLWTKFYKMPGRSFNLNNHQLRISCVQSLSEVSSSYEYMKMIFPMNLDYIREDINQARQLSDKGNYAMCLYESSKAKAELNLISSTMGVSQKAIKPLINEKLSAAKRSISEEEQRGIFPIMAYSYYQYANSLKDSDEFSALLYAEEAIELSYLDIYFSQTGEGRRFLNSSNTSFIKGFLIGVDSCLLIWLINEMSESHKKKRIKHKIKVRKIVKKPKKKRKKK